MSGAIHERETDARHRIDALERRAERSLRASRALAAELEANARRRSALDTEVGAAKWRIKRKDVVDAVMTKAQGRLHARSVGSYERLLTGITQDVLGPGLGVILELGTSRGKPSLDIVLNRRDGRIDVSRASGGSTKNMLSTGLRAAAIVKSGQRQLMVLDEPDAWLAPENIAPFGRVVQSLADELGLQILMITHHAIDQFPGAFVVRLEGTPDTTLCAVPQTARPRHGAEDGDRLESIRMVDFLSHEDTLVPLSPGLTCLIGANDIGKSATVNALRAITQGDLQRGDIRHGREEATIEVRFADGRVAVVTQSTKRHVKRAWRLEAADGTTSRSEGESPPDFIRRAFKMDMVGDLELQIGRQDPPTFLTGDVGSKRAEILSVGEESVHLDRLMERWSRRQREDAATIKSGEAEAGRLERRDAAIADGAMAVTALEKIARELKACRAREDASETIDARLEAMRASRAAIARAKRRGEAATFIPSRPDLADVAAADATLSTIALRAARRNMAADLATAFATMPDETPRIVDARTIATLVDALRDRRAAIAATRRRISAMAFLPGVTTRQEDATALEATANALKTAAARRSAAERESASASAAIAAQDSAIAAWIAANGDVCPTCGRDGFGHAHAAATAGRKFR